MKPRCKFYEVSPPDERGFAIYRCEVCHRRPIVIPATDPARIYADCLPPKSFCQKAARLAKEVVRWLAAGSPTRSKTEIARIYTDLCLPCEHFRPTDAAGTCKLCSCSLKRQGGILNKISLETSHCPIRRW